MQTQPKPIQNRTQTPNATLIPRNLIPSAEIEALGYRVSRTIREFGVFDSDVSVDAGWLEPVGARPAKPGFLPPLSPA